MESRTSYTGRNDDNIHILPNEETEHEAELEEIDSASANVSREEEEEPSTADRNKKFIIVGTLFCINLLNYMDRFTIPALLDTIKEHFKIEDDLAGLLQTSFICSYMILSPIFGFIGDRYNRVILIIVGITFWSAATFGSSFIPEGRDNYWWFLFMRALVGIGEASYSTVAPTILADLFTGDTRIKVLAFFYFAVPLGSGLGYIIGGQVAALFNSWRAALRVTPIFGIACILLIVFLVRDPKRGGAEGGTHLRSTSYLTDLKVLLTNKAYMACGFGFTSVAFVAGAYSWWAPIFITYAMNSNPDAAEVGNLKTNSLIFGLITLFAGILGVLMGSESARRLRPRWGHADPIVCAFGMLGCTPFLFFALIASNHNSIVTFILVFLGETLLCFNWALVSDIVLSVVLPTRRSTASAVQILFSHLFGDAGSPWIIGEISKAVQKANFNTTAQGSAVKVPVYYQFLGLQYGLFTTVFVAALGGGCFLACALWYREDKLRVENVIKASQAFYQQAGDSLEPTESVEAHLASLSKDDERGQHLNPVI